MDNLKVHEIYQLFSLAFESRASASCVIDSVSFNTMILSKPIVAVD